MRHFDVFNGDADGICALRQLRLAEPLEATLITGLKRDIALLKDLPAACGDHVTVLDVSLDRNREALVALLDRGVQVRYFDHHAERIERLRELGESVNYKAYGDTTADVLVPPADLYRMASCYSDPFEFAEQEPLIARLTKERGIDLDRALAAGIDRLDPDRLDGFLDEFSRAWQR